MKKAVVLFALFAVFSVGHVAKADTCDIDNPCGNGSPEMVVNVWGTNNAGIPHIKPGQTVNGLSCPAWFPMDCVDIRGTQYFISRWGNL